MNEQVEEEDAAQEIVDAFEKVNGNIGAMFQVDAWLRKRD